MDLLPCAKIKQAISGGRTGLRMRLNRGLAIFTGQ